MLSRSAKLDVEQQRFERWRLDKPLFARQVLGYTTLKPFQAAMMRFRGEEHLGRQIAIRLLPRDSGKSWCGCIASAIHDVCCGTDKVAFGPDIRLEIIAESLDTAVMFLGEIKQQFESNNDLIRFYGKHINETGTWSQRKIVSAQRRRISKEPTIEALGATGAVVGRHVDGQYFDDVVSERTSDSALKRSKLERFYDKSAMPVLEQGGFQFINGTRYFDEDLYGYLIERYGLGVVFRVPAIITTSVGEELHKRSYFPERYGVDTLLQLQRANPYTFASQYMNDTGLLVSGIITPGVIKITSSSEWPSFDQLNFYIGVDPATSTKSNADYFSTCTIGYNPLLHKAYVFRSTKSRLGDADSMMRKVAREWLWVRENGGDVVEISLETNAFQQILIEHVNSHPDEFGVLPIHGKQTVKDKTTRLIAIAHWFNLGNVIFDEDCIDLLNDVLKFPDVQHDDAVDSMMLAFQALDIDAASGYTLPVDAYELGDTNASIIVF